MKRRAFMGCLLACVLMMAQIAVADQVTLQASKDNTLFEDDNGALSNGKGIHMFVGKVGAAGNLKKRRGVIAFNFAGIPAGATIDRVILTLNMSRTIQPMARTVMLHRLSKDWGEGTSNAGLTQDGDGAPSTPNDATWVHTFFDTGSWGIGILGGDFSSTASASRDIGVIGSYTWDSNSPGNGNAGMRNDVQAWLDGTAGNFGWLLLQGDETSPASVASVKQFDTREAADPTIRPKLEVFYTPNRPPVAVTQSVTTAEDTLVGVTLTGSDVDGDTLTFAIVTGPANGVLSGTPPTLTYTPAANFNSTDSFTFRVSDGIVTSPPATVTVTVTSVNTILRWPMMTPPAPL